jgi:hypothetical protein
MQRNETTREEFTLAEVRLKKGNTATLLHSTVEGIAIERRLAHVLRTACQHAGCMGCRRYVPITKRTRDSNIKEGPGCIHPRERLDHDTLGQHWLEPISVAPTQRAHERRIKVSIARQEEDGLGHRACHLRGAHNGDVRPLDLRVLLEPVQFVNNSSRISFKAPQHTRI